MAPVTGAMTGPARRFRRTPMTTSAVPASATDSPPGDPYLYDAFISYSPQDEPWVREFLAPTLQREGCKALLDPRDLDGVLGLPYLRVCELAVDRSRYTVAVLTPAWVEG